MAVAGMMIIREASPKDAATLARIIRESNSDVAIRFGLNANNCPNHPSFCAKAWIETDIARGERYFIIEESQMPAGCVAYTLR